VAFLLQDAQQSQRDRAAGCVSFDQKSKNGTGMRYFADIINLSSNTVTIGLQSYRIRWKTQNKGYYAVQGDSRSFKVIQGVVCTNVLIYRLAWSIIRFELMASRWGSQILPLSVPSPGIGVTRIFAAGCTIGLVLFLVQEVCKKNSKIFCEVDKLPFLEKKW